VTKKTYTKTRSLVGSPRTASWNIPPRVDAKIEAKSEAEEVEGPAEEAKRPAEEAEGLGEETAGPAEVTRKSDKVIIMTCIKAFMNNPEEGSEAEVIEAEVEAEEVSPPSFKAITM
jgi:hypothetical protein